jgi:hypothetical protein
MLCGHVLWETAIPSSVLSLSLSPSPGLADIEITNLAFGCNLAEDNNVTRTDISTLIFLHSMSFGLWISVCSKASTAGRLKSEDLGISV